MSKQGINPGRMMTYLLALALLGFCGCKTLKTVEKTPTAIEKNRTAIEGSTAAIRTNQMVVEQSTAAIAKNAKTLDKIVAATDQLKTDMPAVILTIALMALLLIAPFVLALLTLWRMNRLTKLWLRKENVPK